MVLVFGVGGQFGQELTNLATDRLLVGVERTEADITNPAQVAAAISAARPSVVINAAAYTAVDRAESEPEEAERVNALGPEIVARACAIAGIPMIWFSTDYVFDGSNTGVYLEDDPVSPLGVYGRSKAEGEARVRSVLERHVILRTSWLYGFYGRNFLKTILRLARERDELAVVADQIGCPTGTADLAAATLCVADQAAADDPIWGTYHFVGTGATSWHGFACKIIECQASITGRRPAVRAITSAEYPAPCRRPPNSVLDCTKFFAAFGFRGLPWQERTADVVARLLSSAAIGVTQ